MSASWCYAVHVSSQESVANPTAWGILRTWQLQEPGWVSLLQMRPSRSRLPLSRGKRCLSAAATHHN